MITLEKDTNAEEIFIHGTPEDIRDFAKTLWDLSVKGDSKGKHTEQLTTKDELSSQLKGEARKHTVVKKLTIHCRA